MPEQPRTIPRQRRNLRRLGALGGVAAVAFVVGLISGARHEPAERGLATAWTNAWRAGDYRAMYALLTPSARERTSLDRFTAAYHDAAVTATLARLKPERPRVSGSRIVVPVDADTRIFGHVRGEIVLGVGKDDASGEPRIAWAREDVFPGLRRGDKLTRETTLPPRATLEARDGTALAEGEARLSDLGPVAAEVAGRVGPAPESRADELAARGVPDGAAVGLTGLELEFDEELAGTPGGVLRAGGRLLATSRPRAGHTVRTTIDPDVQRAAVTALAGRYGGITAVRPRDGAVLAMAGLASSAPQPPGSVFKIVTLTGALQAHTTRPSATFPVQTSATLEGVELQNAHGESCGGTLMTAFAKSCNSVFAPLGAALGAKQLVATAERFGFNEDPGIAGAARATIPAASEIGDDLAVGSTAIGQGKVLATPLTMALAAAAIGEGGRRPRPTFLRGARRPTVQATTPAVARTVTRAMRGVVTSGTGVGANIPGVRVAGKTGTAELRSTVSQDPEPVDPSQPPVEEDTTDTDAWFAAFAPMHNPRIAVCVLLVAQGAGGETAAPAARVVLESALRR
jgi:cell division protein FtsI/penicillin-binding protein 2